MTPTEDGAVTVTALSPDLLDVAAALAPTLRAHAEANERARRLVPPVVDALKATPLFRMGVPRALGGLETDPLTTLRVIEELSAADGATGWCMNIHSGTATVSGLIAEDVARELWARPDAIAGGAFAPKGRADIVDGGYRVSGRWPFASGCQHCDVLVGGAIVFEGGEPRMLGEGIADFRMMIFPASDVEIIETWDVAGLQGTGSHDIAVRNLFVPRARTFSVITPNDGTGQTGELYAFPTLGLLAAQVASVPLGIARRAIDELVTLAEKKTPTGSGAALAQRPVTQHEVARAEATLRGGRAFLHESVADVWDLVTGGGRASPRQRALIRLAAAHATACAVAAVDIAYTLGGGSSLYASNALQRQLRDVHAITQHILAAPANYETAGRVLLGLEPAGLL